MHTGIMQNGFIRLFSRLTLSRNVAIVLTVAALMAGASTYFALTQSSADTNKVYWLLNLDLVLLLLLGTVVARQVVKLWLERKSGAAGSRLHVRLVLVFSFLAAVPAILMAVFSALFFYFGIQTWFNDRVSTAVNESLEVAQAYMKEHQQVMRADVLAMANDLSREAVMLVGDNEVFDKMMQTQSMFRNLSEAIVVNSAGEVLARAPLSLSLELAGVSQKDLAAARDGEVVLMTGDAHDRIRALVRLERFFDSYLYVGRMVDSSVLTHMRTAEQAVHEYATLEGRSSQMQIAATALFIAVALLLLLAAVWFGLRFSEQLATPISALIGAAERVRSGDLTVRVQNESYDDELGLLGRAFNRMTSQIQAVLSGVSSGVVALDARGAVTLANARAAELLRGDSESVLAGERIESFVPAVAGMFAAPDTQTTLQVEHAIADGPRRTLMFRVTGEQGGSGMVVTIDDITALVAAQRKAAWSDVARRIAHEIKNPLTPIQLSAERLKRKYLPQIQEDPDTFQKCTETIIRQVNDIGHMVSEFSSYARMPLPVRKIDNIVDVCQNAMVLQREAQSDIAFGFIAASPVVMGNFDAAQITQVINNLLLNAIDSIRDRQDKAPGEGHVRVTVEDKGDNIVLSVEDNGAGIPDQIRAQILEPYVTTKKKGSGLGLAIVKKIMEDHGGSVVLENYPTQDMKSGAKAVIVLPKDIHA
ncbi:MAG: PAS domain-containing sensor histidine kinase [Alphaproteobacteria bacterium]|nr:PAS domain-containing sensor histidine kinase [Alphaproteobacteria bacterium]